MGFSPFRIPGKPHVQWMHGYWRLRRAPDCPLCAERIKGLSEQALVLSD
jgi:hypothetical protein